MLSLSSAFSENCKNGSVHDDTDWDGLYGRENITNRNMLVVDQCTGDVVAGGKAEQVCLSMTGTPSVGQSFGFQVRGCKVTYEVRPSDIVPADLETTEAEAARQTRNNVLRAIYALLETQACERDFVVEFSECSFSGACNDCQIRITSSLPGIPLLAAADVVAGVFNQPLYVVDFFLTERASYELEYFSIFPTGDFVAEVGEQVPFSGTPAQARNAIINGLSSLGWSVTYNGGGSFTASITQSSLVAKFGSAPSSMGLMRTEYINPVPPSIPQTLWYWPNVGSYQTFATLTTCTVQANETNLVDPVILSPSANTVNFPANGDSIYCATLSAVYEKPARCFSEFSISLEGGGGGLFQPPPTKDKLTTQFNLDNAANNLYDGVNLNGFQVTVDWMPAAEQIATAYVEEFNRLIQQLGIRKNLVFAELVGPTTIRIWFTRLPGQPTCSSIGEVSVFPRNSPVVDGSILVDNQGPNSLLPPIEPSSEISERTLLRRQYCFSSLCRLKCEAVSKILQYDCNRGACHPADRDRAIIDTVDQLVCQSDFQTACNMLSTYRVSGGCKSCGS